MDKPGIPRPTLSRLPLYHRFLAQVSEAGRAVVSSEEMGRALNLPAAQIRKDLSCLAEFGRPGVGYEVAELLANLEEFLGLANDKEAVVVGAGRLGQALASYPGFAAYGLRIVALFDVDPAKIGLEVAERPVFALEKLADLVGRLHIQMGIITVPAAAAQAVADAMVAAGITVIWNFAPARVGVPAGIWLESEDLASHLATLSYHIKRRGRKA
ncbi:MAG TPA: redox-sensing transcriptional repressor Rex [Anaerolineae bacterium]|nr:redox-sensing transcriptional repressor Rex [Anaerolineae bacterium]HOR01431.1 redox-sensing transcriptional repressor Rex [Anaerolineae bacterium]HPL30851.1 redox-sensing transcriptional repressor Rex [Anaerolineae bacterium]